jgi:hypothetical protein
MHLFLVAIALVIAASAFGISTIRARSASAARPGGRLSSARLKSMSEREVEKLLAAVERSPEPEPTMGAMCYDMAGPPSTCEYVCPACGEKTVYSDDNTWLLSYELPTIRLLIEQAAASGLDMALDESRFCSSCTPGEVDPGLLLEIEYEDGREIVSEISEFDARLLAGLLSGELSYVTENDGSEPLRPELGRLRELLGVPDR